MTAAAITETDTEEVMTDIKIAETAHRTADMAKTDTARTRVPRPTVQLKAPTTLPQMPPTMLPNTLSTMVEQIPMLPTAVMPSQFRPSPCHLLSKS
jgi:hypothetical protein